MIGREVDFGLNNFGKQNILSQSESMAQLIINLLLMKPGQMPSMPHMGINIKKWLYEFEDDLNTLILQREIEEQCSIMVPYINTENMVVTFMKRLPEPVLLIIIPFDIMEDGKDLVIGFKKSTNNLGKVTFNYEFQDRDLLK